MTYTPPLNGGRINATISGNTAGAGALLSTGTVTFAGGNNITLSQAGNAITISGAAGGGAAGSNTLGISNLGNSAGTSGIISGSALQFAFAGGNNVTLSQSINASSATITVSGANQTVQTQNLVDLTLAGNSTSAGGGYALMSSGTVTLAGGNNITLSQNANAVTVSAANQTTQTQNLHNITLSGNTAGAMAHVSSGTLTLAGGNNITLSQAGNAITISGAAGGGAAFSAGMSNIGNTSGTSGTVSNQLVLAGGNNITLSQSTAAGGNTITISAAAGGGADGYNSAQFTNSTANSTMPILWAGNSNGSGNITMGLTGSTMTASAAAGGGAAAVGSYFDNMFQQNSVQGITFTSVSTGMFGRVLVQPLAPGNELFPYDISASAAFLNFSNSGSSASSAAHSSSFYIGVYTRVNSTQLSLLNSAMTSITMNADVSNSNSYRGARWLSYHSTLFSSAPIFRAGTRYFFAFLARSSGATYASHSLGGMHLGHSIQRSGYLGATATSNTSFNAWHPFMGVHSLTTHTALPNAIANSEINKASVYANFIPQIILDAGLGVMN